MLSYRCLDNDKRPRYNAEDIRPNRIRGCFFLQAEKAQERGVLEAISFCPTPTMLRQMLEQEERRGHKSLI